VIRGLYQSIGQLASAAHANGDNIDENVYANNDGTDKHGLNVFHDGRYLRSRAVHDEPRFTVDCPYVFSHRFRTATQMKRFLGEPISTPIGSPLKNVNRL